MSCHQCYEKAERKNNGILKKVKSLKDGYLIMSMYLLSVVFTTQSQLFTPLEKKAFENIEGKGENAGNQHFLLFPTMFSTLPNRNFCYLVRIILSSANALNLD